MSRSNPFLQTSSTKLYMNLAQEINGSLWVDLIATLGLN